MTNLTSSHGEPTVDSDKWSLTIDGLVEQPLRFSYDEIRRQPPFETTLTLECISNAVGGKLIGNALWSGTELRPLLAQARIKPEGARGSMPQKDTRPAIRLNASCGRPIFSHGR